MEPLFQSATCVSMRIVYVHTSSRVLAVICPVRGWLRFVVTVDVPTKLCGSTEWQVFDENVTSLPAIERPLHALGYAPFGRLFLSD